MSRTSTISACLLAVTLLFTASGCDSTDANPAPALSVEAVVSENVVETSEVMQVATYSQDDVAEVRLAPFRESPSEPDLAERYRLSQITADALSAASGEAYSAGYYLLEDQTPRGDLAFGPAECGSDEPCFPLILNDSRIGVGTNAVFFPVRDDAETGPPLRLLPLGIGAAGQITVRGNGESSVVDVPSIGTPAADFAQAGSVRVVRGTSSSDLLIVVRQQGALRTVILEASQPSLIVEAPATSGAVEVFLLAAE